MMVALRKESVDRNTSFCLASLFDLPSLSARRAWIEMQQSIQLFLVLWVALRKESVDRNILLLLNLSILTVALRKESVDRNPLFRWNSQRLSSRSPQGERG